MVSTAEQRPALRRGEPRSLGPRLPVEPGDRFPRRVERLGHLLTWQTDDLPQLLDDVARARADRLAGPRQLPVRPVAGRGLERPGVA
eukprot:1286394-Pyramimonas_sp.AAC.1